MNKFIAIIPLLTSCIIVAPDDATTDDSCMAPGQNYSETFVETSGTCGPRNPSTISLGSDSNIILASGVTCQVSQNNGCESVHQCALTNQIGCQLIFDSHMTFSNDGSFTGTEGLLIQCPDGSYCSSQYRVAGKRQ